MSKKKAELNVFNPTMIVCKHIDFANYLVPMQKRGIFYLAYCCEDCKKILDAGFLKDSCKEDFLDYLSGLVWSIVVAVSIAGGLLYMLGVKSPFLGG